MAGASPPRCAVPSPVDLEVEITIEADVDLPSGVTAEALESFTLSILAAEGERGSWQLSVRFVDDEAMRRAHDRFMGIDSPTDIMTFPYEDDGFDLVSAPGEELPNAGGDLMISVERATEHAREVGWETDCELFFLVCHGVLHILGWDDETEEDRSLMLDHQASLLVDWLDNRERVVATH
jgi:probable rRNA maturation factor